MASIQKRKQTTNGTTTYRVRFHDPSGRSKSKTFDRMAEARAFANNVETDKNRGGYVAPGAGRTEFGEFAAQVMVDRGHLKPATVATEQSLMRSLVVSHFDKYPLGAVTRGGVQDWVNTIGKTHSPSTVRQAKLMVGHVFSEAVEAGLVVRSPVRGIKLPSPRELEPRFLTVEEIHRLADTIDDRYRVLILTAAYTGARFGELAAVKVGREGLDLLRSRLTITQTLNEVSGEIVIGTTKTGKSHAVALPAFLVDELARHLQDHDGEFVFTSPDGGPLRRGNFRRRVWLPAVAAADLEGVTFHDLRHTHASLLIAAGEHPKLISSRLGHSKISITMDVYGHLFPGLDEDAADRLDDLAKNI